MENKYESVTKPRKYQSTLGLNRYQHKIENLQSVRICLISCPFILPCLMVAVTWFGTWLLYGKSDTEMIGIMASAAGGAGLLLLLLFLPAVCVRRTAAPSAWQRFCRFYLFYPAKWIVFIFLFSIWFLWMLMNQPKQAKQEAKHFNTYFKYWLSHPDEEPTPEHCEKIVQADTSKFDWQDPNQWPDLKDLPTKEII